MDKQRAFHAIDDALVDADEGLFVVVALTQPDKRQQDRHATCGLDHLHLEHDTFYELVFAANAIEMINACARDETVGELRGAGVFDQAPSVVPTNLEALGGVHGLCNSEAEFVQALSKFGGGFPVDVRFELGSWSGRVQRMGNGCVGLVHRDVGRRVNQTHGGRGPQSGKLSLVGSEDAIVEFECPRCCFDSDFQPVKLSNQPGTLFHVNQPRKPTRTTIERHMPAVQRAPTRPVGLSSFK